MGQGRLLTFSEVDRVTLWTASLSKVPYSNDNSLSK